GVNGPLARTVSDVAWLLGVMAGPDDRDASCFPSKPSAFLAPLDRDLKGVRVAWCPDLGGLPLDRRVRTVLDGQRTTFESLGCFVDEACPDFGDVDAIFLALRAWRTAAVLEPVLRSHRDHVKPEAVKE